MLTHCKHELVHAIWKILLDDEFLEAYQNGIVLQCHDGMLRQIFPCIFTYSADYPEKYSNPPSACTLSLTSPHGRVLLATIQDKGLCPCPLCLIPKSEYACIGLVSNMSARLAKVRKYFSNRIRAAHDAIYKQGSPIKGTTPEHYLKPFSLVPTFISDILHSGQLQETKLMLKHVFAEVL